MLLKFIVKGQEIKAEQPTIVEKTVDFIDAEFSFTPEWLKKTKTAYFANGAEKYKIILENDKISKDKHLNLKTGVWKVFVEGYDAPEKITTEEVAIYIKKTGKLDGTIPPETPPTQIEQLIEKSANAERIAQSVRNDADAGKFKGDKGDPYAHSVEFETLSKQVRDDTLKSAQSEKNASAFATQSKQSATASETSAKASETSKMNAKTSETNAKTSETNAKTSETNAQKSLEDVNTVKGLVEDYKVAIAELVKLAEQHEKNASASATNAAIETAEKLTAQINTALNKAETATAGAEKVDIIAWQDASGLTVVTTNRQGEKTECRLSEAVVHINSWKDIQSIVRGGLAKKFIKPGDIFNANYKYNGKVYTMPWHVCDVRNVTTPNGEIKEAVIIQSHIVSPKDVEFDSYEAFYKAPAEGLPAGTYHMKMGYTWSKVQEGDTWSFTLTKPLPAGAVLTGFRNAADVADLTGTEIKSYTNVADTEPLEVATIRKGAEGTLLGTFTAYGDATIKGLQRVAYGYNRWRDSYQRQWLNNKGLGWWKPQHDYDRPPDAVATTEGFMTGFENEFLDVLRPFKQVTAANTTEDSGENDVTYDIFTLPSLEEMYIAPQAPGIEGDAFPYWKEVGGAEPFPWYQALPELVHLDLNGSSRYVRLRSANRYYSYDTWYVITSGYVSYNYSRSSFCGAPLAAIY